MAIRSMRPQVKLSDILYVITADFEYHQDNPELKTTDIVVDEKEYIVSKITNKYITISDYQGFAYGRHLYSNIGCKKEAISTFVLKNSKYSTSKTRAVEKEITKLSSYIEDCTNVIKRHTAMKKDKDDFHTQVFGIEYHNRCIKAEEIFIELYKKKVPKKLELMIKKYKRLAA